MPHFVFVIFLITFLQEGPPNSISLSPAKPESDLDNPQAATEAK